MPDNTNPHSETNQSLLDGHLSASKNTQLSISAEQGAMIEARKAKLQSLIRERDSLPDNPDRVQAAEEMMQILSNTLSQLEKGPLEAKFLFKLIDEESHRINESNHRWEEPQNHGVANLKIEEIKDPQEGALETTVKVLDKVSDVLDKVTEKAKPVKGVVGDAVFIVKTYKAMREVTRNINQESAGRNAYSALVVNEEKRLKTLIANIRSFKDADLVRKEILDETRDVEGMLKEARDKKDDEAVGFLENYKNMLLGAMDDLAHISGAEISVRESRHIYGEGDALSGPPGTDIPGNGGEGEPALDDTALKQKRARQVNAYDYRRKLDRDITQGSRSDMAAVQARKEADDRHAKVDRLLPDHDTNGIAGGISEEDEASAVEADNTVKARDYVNLHAGVRSDYAQKQMPGAQKAYEVATTQVSAQRDIAAALAEKIAQDKKAAALEKKLNDALNLANAAISMSRKFQVQEEDLENRVRELEKRVGTLEGHFNSNRGRRN